MRNPVAWLRNYLAPPVLPAPPPAQVARGLDREGNRALLQTGGLLLSVLITAGFGYLGVIKSAPPKPAPITADCPRDQDRVIALLRQNPELTPRYSGALDEQCHLNDLVDQIKKEHKQPALPPAPTPPALPPAPPHP